MTPGRATAWVIGAWVVAIGLISLREIASQPSTASGADRMPKPEAYLGSAVLFTLLGLLGLGAPGLAVALAVGTDVGLLVQPYLQGKPGILDTAASWLNRVAPPPKPAGGQ